MKPEIKKAIVKGVSQWLLLCVLPLCVAIVATVIQAHLTPEEWPVAWLLWGGIGSVMLVLMVLVEIHRTKP